MAYRPTDGHTHMVTHKDMSHGHTHIKTAELHSQINSYIYYIRHIFRFNILGLELGCIIFWLSSATQLCSEFYVIWVPYVFAFPLLLDLSTDTNPSEFIIMHWNNQLHRSVKIPFSSFIFLFAITIVRTFLFPLEIFHRDGRGGKFNHNHFYMACWGCIYWSNRLKKDQE